MVFRYRLPWILLLVMVLLAWAVLPASAHALLVRSTPAANAVLTQAPVQVELFFSEALEPELSSLRVLDSNKLPVDAGDVRVDPDEPTRLTVSLHALPDGVYTVTWKVVSAVDGHQGLGTFPFAVGDVSAAALNSAEQSSSFRLPFSTLVAKFLMLAALALLLGQHLFTFLIWPASLTPVPSIPIPPIWTLIYRTALITLLTSIGIGMLAQAGQTSGRELGFPWGPELGRILLETRLGLIWLGRLALAMILVWLFRDGTSRWKRGAALAAGLGLLYTVALTSHAATDAHPALPVLAHTLHLLGMTFWFGGLVYFLTALRSVRSEEALDDEARAARSAALASRFSLYALGFVTLIGLTGLYSAYLRVGAFSALVASLYGHVLLVKQVLVAGLLSIAAINLLVISPRLRQARLTGTSAASTLERFGRLVLVELTLAALLLGSVSFLTYIPPAKLSAPNFDLAERAQVDDLQLELMVSPGRVGLNTFLLTVRADHEPLYLAKEVLLRFTPAQASLPPSELQLTGQGDGTFTARGSYLSTPGDWQVQAVVRRQDRFDAFANFSVTLKVPGAAEANRMPQLAGILLLLPGLLCAMLSLPLRPDPWWRPALGLPAALLLAGLGIYVMTRPLPVDVALANPVPPNSESIARGQDLFLTSCAPCHGTAGKGDGPVALTLNPRPADLTQHAIPGVHTDAQLFEWITNGFPGTQMPAFKSTLSDTDRWHLVNFIRTFAP